MITPAVPPTNVPPGKKRHRLRNWLIGIGVAIIALIGGLVGCAALVGTALNHAANPTSVSQQPPAQASNPASDPASPAPAGPAQLRIGDAASVSQDGAAAATIVLDNRAVSSQAVDQYSNGPQNGYFVSVHVKVTGAAGLTTGFDINPLDFYALSGNSHYDEGDANAYEGPDSNSQLEATTLNAGETASGWLQFDLPSPHGEIVYAPNLNGQPLAYWKF